MSTSTAVRNDMRDWTLVVERDGWIVKLDVKNLGGHFDTTFRGWSAGQAGYFSAGAHLCPLAGFSWEAPGSSVNVYSWCSPWFSGLLACHQHFA